MAYQRGKQKGDKPGLVARCQNEPGQDVSYAHYGVGWLAEGVDIEGAVGNVVCTIKMAGIPVNWNGYIKVLINKPQEENSEGT